MSVNKWLLSGVCFCSPVWALLPFEEYFSASTSVVNVEVSFNVQQANDLVRSELGLESVKQPLKGMCASGGGSRSLSLERGYLGALSHIMTADGEPLLDSFNYVSAVSGAAWALAAYFSSPASRRNQLILDVEKMNLHDIFLSHPTNDTAGNVNRMSPYSLGSGPQRLGGLKTLTWQLAWGVISPFGYGDRTWASVINEQLLVPFDVPSFVPLKEAFQGEGSGKEVIIVSAVRDNDGDMHLLEMTSQHVGVRSRRGRVGGYMLPSEGFGLKATEREGNVITLRESGELFSLSDALSGSSDNYAHLAALMEDKMPWLLGFLPGVMQWFVNAAVPNIAYPLLDLDRTDFENEVFELVDAGRVDYLGITPLLARGVKKIVVFVNTDIPLLEVEYNGQNVIGVEKAIPALFGVCPDEQAQRPGYIGLTVSDCKFKALKFNQVFEEQRFQEVAEGLLASKREGKAIVYEQSQLKVLPNSHYAIEGGYDVDLFWVYNDLPDRWLENLPENVRQLVEEDERFKCNSEYCSHPKTRFPHNSAMYELDLAEAPSNLLTVLAFNTLMNCSERLKLFFDR